MTETNDILRSQDNLKKLKTLSEQLGFDGIRLMLDPQKTISAEAVVEDICLYLQDTANNSMERAVIKTAVY